MSRVRVSAGARIHFGFLNLSLAHDRLYGSVGVSVDEPRTVVVAEPGVADAVAERLDGYERTRQPLDDIGDRTLVFFVER